MHELVLWLLLNLITLIGAVMVRLLLVKVLLHVLFSWFSFIAVFYGSSFVLHRLLVLVLVEAIVNVLLFFSLIVHYLKIYILK